MVKLNSIELRYFFDPLCGWCYASAPALAAVAEQYGSALVMMPSGLFMTARAVADMADHAWRNDQRIATMTGQRFTEAYRERVLHAPDGVFDSTALTKALVALGQINPALEARFLGAAQTARYVEGQDTSEAGTAAQIAVQTTAEAGVQLDYETFVARLRNDPSLARETHKRVETTQGAMRGLPSSGVPQLQVLVEGRSHILNGQELYSGRQVLEHLASLAVAA